MILETPWLARFPPVQALALRLICFPYAGGSASLFRPWASPAALAGVEVCAVELPGHGTRRKEPCLTRFAEVVEQTVDSLLPFLDAPFALFGHSLGALLSFEVARTLEQNGNSSPACLCVSGCCAPQVLGVLPKVSCVEELIAYLRALGSQPNESMIARRWPLFQADFALRASYQYAAVSAPLSCSIAAFGGEQDHEVSLDDLASWKVQTRNTFRLHQFPGNHFFLHTTQEQVVHQVLQTVSCVRQNLEKTQ